MRGGRGQVFIEARAVAATAERDEAGCLRRPSRGVSPPCCAGRHDSPAFYVGPGRNPHCGDVPFLARAAALRVWAGTVLVRSAC